MGIINNIKMYFKRAEFNKDFNANDTLMKYYGEEATINSILEIKKMSSKRFAETIDVSDQLLDKYKEKNDKDIQNELLKKYLKLSQDDLNKELLLEDEKITDEIDDTLKDQNLSEEEKKKIKEETLEEKRKGKLEGKDKEKELKTKLYEKAYNHLYKDYAYKVEKIKNAQFDSRSLALGTEEAMEIIAMEKGLEKVDLLYHNHTGRDISQIETIKAEKDSFERKMTYNENGIQNIANNNALKLYEKYKESMEKYKIYINGLKNPNVKPAEKAMLKKQYEESKLELIQSVPSLQEYSKELKTQDEIEKMATKEIGGQSITMSGKSMDENERKISDTITADNIHDVIDEKISMDQRGFEHSRQQQENAIREGDYQAAKEIGDAQREERIYNEGIDNNENGNVSAKTQRRQEREQEIDDRDFARSLTKINNIENKSPEELQKIVEDREEDEKEKIREVAQEQKAEQEEYQREFKKKNQQ